MSTIKQHRGIHDKYRIISLSKYHYISVELNENKLMTNL